MFTALLDTSVLWPSLQRDFLLSLAAEHVYRPIWSDAILAELERHEFLKLVRRGTAPEEASERARFLVSEMGRAFDDAVIGGWEPFQGSYGLPDPDDEHVLAAAVVGGAGAIVTANLKDFPKHCLPAGLQVLSAPEFAYDAVSANPIAGLQAVAAISLRSGSKGPSRSTDELLDLLEGRYGLVQAVDMLRSLSHQGHQHADPPAPGAGR